MFVIIPNENCVAEKVAKGEAFASKGHSAFEDRAEALEWAEDHIGHDKFKLYELCDCEPSHFIDMGSAKYKSMRKILVQTKITMPKG